MDPAVIAALVMAFGSTLTALVTMGLRKAARAEDAALKAADIAMESAGRAAVSLDAIEKNTKTNGSNKTLGELVELMYTDLQQSKRELAAHERKTDAHGIQAWERRER
jgi:hypothetical protein